MSFTLTVKRSCAAVSLGLVTLLMSAPAHADAQTDLLRKVSSVVNKNEAIVSNFSQSKRLKGFNSAANSSGQVVIARNTGLVWITNSPFQSKLRVTPNGISEARGGSNNFSATNQDPKVRGMSNAMMAVFSGDFGPLQRYFRVQGNATGSSWSMNLTPTDAQMSRAISSIQMSGGSYVNRITIHEANGDLTSIQFSGGRAVDRQSATVRQYF